MTITLYYSPGACSLASHIILTATGAAFETQRIVIAEGMNKQPAFLAVNPKGRVPVLQVGDTIITENMAILAYLGHCFAASKTLPQDNLQFARCLELMSYFSGTVHVNFAHLWRPERYVADEAIKQAVSDAARQNLIDNFTEIEKLMSDGWLMGDHFTIADTYPLVFYRWAKFRVGFDMSAYPKWARHAQRMLALDFVRRTVEAEGLAISEFQ